MCLVLVSVLEIQQKHPCSLGAGKDVNSSDIRCVTEKIKAGEEGRDCWGKGAEIFKQEVVCE